MFTWRVSDLVFLQFLPPFLLHGGPSPVLLHPLLLQPSLPLLQLLLIVLPGSLLTCLPLGLFGSWEASTYTQARLIMIWSMSVFKRNVQTHMHIQAYSSSVMGQLWIMWLGFSSQHKANPSAPQYDHCTTLWTQTRFGGKNIHRHWLPKTHLLWRVITHLYKNTHSKTPASLNPVPLPDPLCNIGAMATGGAWLQQPRLYVTSRETGTSPQLPTKSSHDMLQDAHTNVQSTHTHAVKEYTPFCFSHSPRRSRANLCLSSILLKSNESATQTTAE